MMSLYVFCIIQLGNPNRAGGVVIFDDSDGHLIVQFNKESLHEAGVEVDNESVELHLNKEECEIR